MLHEVFTHVHNSVMKNIKGASLNYVQVIVMSMLHTKSCDQHT